ncbi:MAG: methionine--tRNA ligase [Minisyncoccia bacterium]
MSGNKSFYITTTLPYVNAEPHIGFAMEIIQADVLARWHRELGHEVFFNTGTDEHGQKILEAAEKAGKDVHEYVDYYAGKFDELKKALDLSYDAFIRTTDEKHVRAAKEIWKKCKDKGDIYEKEFEGLYCVGCERFLSHRDIIDSKCSIHPWATPEILKEKNWFFKFSKYENELLKYLNNPSAIIPDWRREEAINFVKEGLEDFSISRDKSRLSWGIPVPDDDTQVMYVWFDALTNYISTLGWPDEDGNFKKFWMEGGTLQLAGKDQVRFQSLMWQAMLMSADIKTTDQVFYHGFINSGGQKMSKSLGNVISPYELVKKYGTDAARYLLLRHVHSTDDTDVTWEKLDEWYNAGLVNGLGNLVSRILTLSEKYVKNEYSGINSKKEIFESLDKFNFQAALDHVWDSIQKLDEEIAFTEPYKVIKNEPEKGEKMIDELRTKLIFIARGLRLFMPSTAEIIHDAVMSNKKPENLFPRLNA